MKGTFTFKGINSASLGVFMQNEWLDSVAPMSYVSMDVEGHDGALYTDLGRKDITIDIPCLLKDPSKANKQKVLAWLFGTGELIIGDKKKTLHIYDQIDFSRVGWSYQSFTIPAIMEPFWHSTSGVQTSITGSGTITNQGTASSRPVIRVHSTSPVTVRIGSVSFTYKGSNTEDLVMYCARQEENAPNLLTIDYAYPVLQPGSNAVTVSDSSAVITFSDKDWWY